MPEITELDCAARLLRADLVRQIEVATNELASARALVADREQTLNSLKSRLRSLEAAVTPTLKEQKVYDKGRTILVRNAIQVLVETENRTTFTPERIRQTILDVFPHNAWLVPHVTDVTKVLIRLTESGKVERVSQGAGLKSPIYQVAASAAKTQP